MKFEFNPIEQIFDLVLDDDDLDGVYFRLDATNSPITGDTTINGLTTVNNNLYVPTVAGSTYALGDVSFSYGGTPYDISAFLGQYGVFYDSDSMDLSFGYFNWDLVDGTDNVGVSLVTVWADVGLPSPFYISIYYLASERASYLTWLELAFGPEESGVTWLEDYHQDEILTAEGAGSNFTYKSDANITPVNGTPSLDATALSPNTGFLVNQAEEYVQAGITLVQGRQYIATINSAYFSAGPGDDYTDGLFFVNDDYTKIQQTLTLNTDTEIWSVDGINNVNACFVTTSTGSKFSYYTTMNESDFTTWATSGNIPNINGLDFYNDAFTANGEGEDYTLGSSIDFAAGGTATLTDLEFDPWFGVTNDDKGNSAWFYEGELEVENSLLALVNSDFTADSDSTFTLGCAAQINSNLNVTGDTTLDTALNGFAYLTSGGVGTSNIGLSDSYVTGILPIAKGGTNLSSLPANGQLLIGGDDHYTLATLTGGDGITVFNGNGSISLSVDASELVDDLVTSLRGTTNQIAVAGNYDDYQKGNLTLSLPQDIATTSNVTFNNLTATGNFNAGVIGTRAEVYGNTNTFTGVAGDKLKVTMNGFIYDDIDISASTTIAEVATAIQSAITDWEEIAFADGPTGFIYVRSNYSSTYSTVSITDGTGGNGGETLRLFASNPTSDTGTVGVGSHALYGTRLLIGDGVNTGLGRFELNANLGENESGAMMYFGTRGTGDAATGLQVFLDKGYTGHGFSRAMWFRNQTQGTYLNYGSTGSATGVTSGTNVGAEGLARNSTTNYRNIAMWAHGGLFKASESVESDPVHLDTSGNAGDGFFNNDLEVKRNFHIDGAMSMYGASTANKTISLKDTDSDEIWQIKHTTHAGGNKFQNLYYDGSNWHTALEFDTSINATFGGRVLLGDATAGDAWIEVTESRTSNAVRMNLNNTSTATKSYALYAANAKTSANADVTMQMYADGLGGTVSGGGGYIGTFTAHDVGIYTNNTQRVLIDGTTGVFSTTSGRIVDITEVTSSTYNVLSTDYHISIQYTSTGTQTTTLPAISSSNHGQVYHLKDADYNAGTNNITVATTGSDTIDGQASGTMNTDGECFTVIANNTTKDWEIQ